MGADLFRKYVSSSMIICYRSVVRHPFLVGMIFLLLLMYRLFPLLFSLLVSASPVIVSTFLLLGTLLSFGQPNIPEIERESKSDQDEIQKLETKVMSHTEIIGRDGSSASVETHVGRIESSGEKTLVQDNDSSVKVDRAVDSCESLQFGHVGRIESSGEKTLVQDDDSSVKVDRAVDSCESLQFGEEHSIEESKNEKAVLESRYAPLQQSEDEHIVLESDEKLWEGSPDPLNSDSGLLWKRVEGDRDDSEDDDGSDSGSDLAESSSPDASMADIIPMLDELHPLLAEEQESREPVRILRDLTDAVSEHSLESSDSSESDDGDHDNHGDLEVGEDEDEDKESKHSDKEDETMSAITWTEDDQKNLMNLGTSELERNRRLENLIARRRGNEENEDKESKHSDKEDETESAITWTEDDQKNLMNLGTSELERNQRLENIIARRRGNEENEDKESKHSDKEDETGSAIRWTEDDQKNLMNLGTSELERNRRLENLIARRRARKTMRMQAEKNLIDLDSADLPWNIPPISTSRNNPFDIDYDANDNVPGSAPSVMLQRRNPFDLPYDSSEEKPDLVGDTFQQEFAAVQPKEQPFFRRHESFNVGPSNFGPARSERQESRLRPYFVPERIASDGSNFSSFQRQFSGLSDKLSSVPDTESVSSAGDLENKDHFEDDLSLEPELISEKEHDHASGLREQQALASESEHLDASEHVSDHVSQGRPVFVPEHEAADGLSLSSFQRQISELSDSKMSSVPDTDSISSSGDFENKDPVEDDLSQEPEVISLKEHVPEAREHVSDDVSQGSESSEDDGNVESIQVEEVERNTGNMINPQELASSMAFMTDATQLNVGHSRESSLSSSYEVSDQIYNEKEGDEMPMSVSEADYYFVDHGNSMERSDIDIPSLLEEGQPKEPVYDLSPRSITKNLSSSSISIDLQAGMSERGQSLTSEGTSSVSGRVSQETLQKTETDNHGNDAEFVASSEQDAAEIESRSIADYNLNELERNLGPSVGEDHPHKDESFWHEEDQLQTSSSIADAKSNSTDSSPEIRGDQDQIQSVPDNEEPMLAGDSISPSLMDMDAYHQLEQVQVPLSKYQERSHEDIHQEEVMSKPEEPSLSGSSVSNPSAEDPKELQGHEFEHGQSASTNSEAKTEEVVHGETYESVFSTHHQFVYEEAMSQPQRESPLLDTSAYERSEENPEVLQVKVSSNDSDNLQIQELENNISPSINSVSSPEPKTPESKNVPDNIDYVDDIREIDENLLVELDAVGDFSVKDFGSTLNEMKEDQHAPEHDLQIKRSTDEDSYSTDLGSISNEMKQDPHALEHDLENESFVDEDSYSKVLGSSLIDTEQDPHGLEHDIEGNEDSSKDLGLTLNEMKQDKPASDDLEIKRSGDEESSSENLGSTLNEMKHDLETEHSGIEDSYSKDLGTLNEKKHDLETKLSGDEESYSKDLGSTMNVTKQDPPASEHDLEPKQSGDADSYSMDLGSISNEIVQDPHVLEHDLPTNHSVDEDSYFKDFESSLSETKQDPRASGHILETFYSVDEYAFSKEIESTLNEMKHDLETNLSDHEDPHPNSSETVETDAVKVTKPQNEKEISNTEAAGALEASRTKSVDNAVEAELPEKTESSTSWSNSTSNTDKE